MKELFKKFIDKKSMLGFEILVDRTVIVVIDNFHMTRKQFEVFSKIEGYAKDNQIIILEAFDRYEKKFSYKKMKSRIITGLDGSF